MKTEIDVLNERIAEGKQLLLDQMRMTNERTEEILRLRDVVNSLTEALKKSASDFEFLAGRIERMDSKTQTQFRQRLGLVQSANCARGAVLIALTAAGVA